MKRRTFLETGAVVLTLGVSPLARGANIITVRIWPAPEYSRVTIESDSALSTTHTFVANPPRLAVDMIDKRNLLNGKPTSRTESVSANNQLEFLAKKFAEFATMTKQDLNRAINQDEIIDVEVNE